MGQRHHQDFSFAPEPAARYSAVAIALHWLVALAIIGLLGVGVWMTGLKPSPTKIAVYTWHKWAGLTLLALVLVRLLWRLHRPPPMLAESIPAWQVTTAAYTHRLLYALMLAMPLTGWLQNSAAGFPLTWFGLFKVPALVARDKAAFAFWQQAHECLSWALMALVVLHVLAALKHHFVDKDDTLKRILPWRQDS